MDADIYPHHCAPDDVAALVLERYGYAKARRIGVVAMIGGKDKTALRNGTPPPFRDLLLSIARMTHNVGVEPHSAAGKDLI